MNRAQQLRIKAFLRDIQPTKQWVASWPAWKNRPIELPTAPQFPPVK